MNKKGISTWVIVGIVVIIIIVAGVAAYVLYGGGGEPAPTPTPTPNAIEGATSLGFKVNATIGGNNELYAFTAKNLGASDILLRVDMIDVEGNAFVYLYNQTAQTLWVQYGGEWMDSSADFASYWDGANSDVIGYTALDCYKTELATNWSGSGDHDYTSGGDTFHIYDIIVNPSVEDSMFEHG